MTPKNNLVSHRNNGQAMSGAALLNDLALRANRGVRLSRCSERGLIARPLGPGGVPDPDTLLLPLVPTHIVEYASAFLRHVWQARRTSAMWWLYVHPKQHRWWAYCPPQLCAELEVAVDRTFKGCPTPDPDLWLAGSMRSVPPSIDVGDVEVLRPLLPPHEGVHFLLEVARPLTSLSAYIRTTDGLQANVAGSLIDDRLDPALAHLPDRLMFRTAASH